MEYINHRRYRGQICGGKRVNFPYGTRFQSKGDMILTESGNPVCVTTSQVAYDYFSRNDDGNGLERGKLVREIKGRLENHDKNHQARWDKLWEDPQASALKKADSPGFWVWSVDFYNADISTLKHILSLVKGVK
jgi:hypothetical protein